jgi:hypothetical protein
VSDNSPHGAPASAQTLRSLPAEPLRYLPAADGGSVAEQARGRAFCSGFPAEGRCFRAVDGRILVARERQNDMRMQFLVLHSILFAALIVFVDMVVPSRVAACSCLLPTVESSYQHASDVAFIDLKRTYVSGDTRYYLGRVVRTFKGCLRAGQRVLLKTHVSEATCGVELRLKRYLINGSAAGEFLGAPVLSISLCSYDRQVSLLTDQDQKFLEGRTVCCGDDCSCADGSKPVQCFADPCSVAPECEQGECIANYCGGCNAEFYDETGNAVCEDPSECKTDADCASGSWCRQMQSDGSTPPSYECAPFVGEGARCNGFTLPWLYERCEPGLVCDTPDMIADAPGICRKGCESDKDCKPGSYCASDKLCDEDGACEREVDCNLPGNAYAHIECVGHGVCSWEQRCGYECGVPECVDLAGLDTGPCDAMLGWAVIDGRCGELSGCSTGDFKLFNTGDECRRTCLASEGAPR